MTKKKQQGGPTVKELQDKLSQLAHEKGLLEEQCRELAGRVEQQAGKGGNEAPKVQTQAELDTRWINQQLQSTTTTTAGNGNQYSDLESKYNVLVSSFHQTIDTCKSEAAKVRDENATLARLNEELREELGKEYKQTNQKSRDIDELRREVEAAKSASSDYKHKITDIEGNARRLQQELTASEDTCNKLKSELSSLNSARKQVSDQQKEVRDLQAANVANKRESAELQRKNESLEATIKKQQKDITDVTKENSSLKNEVSELTVAKRKQTDEISDLKATVSKLKGDVSNLQNSLNALKKQAPEKQEDTSILKKENERISRLATDLQGRVTKLDHDLQQSVRASNELKERNEKIQRHAIELQESVTKLEKELQSANEHRLQPSETQEQSKQGDSVQHDFASLDVHNLDGIATQIAEFTNTFATWERTLAELGATQDVAQLLLSIRTVHEDLVKEYHNFKENSTKAGQAMASLRKHEKVFQDQTERLQMYIEKKAIPDSEDYSELLVSISDLAVSHLPNKIKCFISYAWHPDRRKNAALQVRLIKIKEDLEKTGVEVLLDIHNMQGDINRYMIDGIQASDRVLLICTPRFKQRAEESTQVQNNVQKELEAALKKQQADPKFIIPLLLEGDRTTSIATAIESILSLDFTDRKKYCDNMVSLVPKGLIPMILGLERNRAYAQMLKGYLAPLTASGTLKK